MIKTTDSKSVKQTASYVEPKKLSKIGKWMKKNPNGIGVINDMRAVMK